MTHSALADGALSLFLILLTVLLVMFIGAVIVAPLQVPRSDTPQNHRATGPPLPLPGRPPPAASSRTLPRRQPPVTAPVAAVNGWSSADEDTGELGTPQPLMPDRISRPKVSGTPPWGPAPRPPGPDPSATENPTPTWRGWPGERPVFRHPARHASTRPHPGARR
jgi:hypothetical protein